MLANAREQFLFAITVWNCTPDILKKIVPEEEEGSLMEINEATAVTICAREQNKKGDNISYKEVTVL